MKLISFLFVILIVPILTSCTKYEQGGPVYLKARADGQDCQLVCIGERNFPTSKVSTYWGGLINDPKRKNAEGKIKGSSLFEFSPCVVARYAWNAMDQVEIDYGEQICAGVANRDVLIWKDWHCNSFASYSDEKSQIKSTLQACEEKRVKYAFTPKPTGEDLRNQKIAQAKNTCREFGFTSNESLADCALKIYQTEIELSQSNIGHNSSDLLAKQMQLNNSILLMQQGLKLMSPPPRPTLNCMTTLLGWTCN